MEFTVMGFMGESGSGKDFCGKWVVDNQEFCRIAFADPLKRFCGLVFGFDEQQLWGHAEFRNEEVEVDWTEALHRMVEGVDSWVNTLALTLTERAEYKAVVQNWFDECESRTQSGKISPRVALQLLGTEYGRHFKNSLWVDTLFDQVVPWIKEGLGYDKELGGTQDFKHYRGAVITDFRFKNEMTAGREKGAYVIKLIRLSQEGKANEAEEAGIAGHASEAEQRTIPEEDYDLVLRMEDGLENVSSRLEEMFEKREWLPSDPPNAE